MIQYVFIEGVLLNSIAINHSLNSLVESKTKGINILNL